MLRVYCDVTSHNLKTNYIPSGVIWGLIGERDAKSLEGISNVVTIKQGGWVSKNHLAVCNYENKLKHSSF